MVLQLRPPQLAQLLSTGARQLGAGSSARLLGLQPAPVNVFLTGRRREPLLSPHHQARCPWEAPSARAALTGRELGRPGLLPPALGARGYPSVPLSLF